MKRFWVFVLIGCVLALFGCGDSNTATAPSITTQPGNQSVTVGQTATFTVAAAGTAPLNYQWSKNGTAITGATATSYTTPATAAADDGSSFTVTVTNAAGHATSTAATLTVNTPPSITAQPANLTVIAGQTATFSVTATGTAPLSYQWTKNGTNISGATSSSYTTPATASADNGATFAVKVSNAAGNVTSNSATLTVNTPPSITAQPADQAVTAGQTATFSVTAAGTAPLSYQWSKNGTAITGATASSYTTPATVAADNGAQFTVAVSNVAGNVTSNAATLTVNSGSVTGVAASGAPIANAPVTVKDTFGHTSSGTTAADGSFTLDTTGFVPPYLLQVQSPNGNVYSVSADALASTNINVHPYSDLTIRSWYAAQGQAIDAVFANPSSAPAPDPANVQILQNAVTGVIQLWLNKASVDTTQFNLISGTFAANGTGLDKVLDWSAVNLSNPNAPAVTVTDGTTTQNATVTYDAGTSTITFSSTTTNANGTSASSVSTVAPTQSTQQTAMAGINSTMTSVVNTINAKGSQLTGTDLLPFLAADLFEDGLNQTQYAGLLASKMQVSSGKSATASIQTIKSLDAQWADVVFDFTVTGGSVIKVGQKEFWFKNVSGTWLIGGDHRIGNIGLRSETRTYQGTEFGTDGPSLNAAVVAPTGTVSGATISGGSVWNNTALPQLATVVSQPVNLDQFITNSGPLANIPPVGTIFTFAVTPKSGSTVQYTVPSNAFTTEMIHITSPTDSSLSGANLGQPLTVTWTLPTTFAVVDLGLNAEAFGGDPGNPSTSVCPVSPAVGIHDTSATITIPAICGGQPVVYVTIGISAGGSNLENSYSIMGFGSTGGGGGGGGSLAITTASLPSGTLNTSYSQTLQATGGAQPVTWSIVSGNLPPGLQLNGATISGVPTTSGAYSFTVQATDSSQATATAALSITIGTAPLAIVTKSLPQAAVGSPYNVQLQTSGGSGTQVTWSVSSGSLPAWANLNANTGTITGTPALQDVGSSIFTVTATDGTSSPTQSLSLFVNNPGVNNAELSGHYAFTVAGFIDNASYALAGSFVADGNGNITSGTVDVNSNTQAGYSSASITGTYSIGSDQRATMVLSNGKAFAFSVGSIVGGVASLGHIIETDHVNTVIASGVIKKQDTAAFSVSHILGNYAFSAMGGDATGGRYGQIGRFGADGSGNISNGAIDINDYGTFNYGAGMGSSLAFTGTYSSVDANGRTALTLNVGTHVLHQAAYIVSASELFTVSIDPVSSTPLSSGSMLKQSGSLSNGSLNGVSILGISSIPGSGSGSRVQVGTLTTDGAGNFTVFFDQNSAGTLTSGPSQSGTYAITANGRMTISGAGSNPPVFYIVGQNQAFLLGSGASVEFGSFEGQSAGPFNNGSLTGNYIFGEQPPTVNSSVSSGVVTADGNGNLSGTSDQNNAGVTTNESFTDTYNAAANGRVVLPYNIMYLISPSKALLISTETSMTPSITVVEK